MLCCRGNNISRRLIQISYLRVLEIRGLNLFNLFGPDLQKNRVFPNGRELDDSKLVIAAYIHFIHCMYNLNFIFCI